MKLGVGVRPPGSGEEGEVEGSLLLPRSHGTPQPHQSPDSISDHGVSQYQIIYEGKIRRKSGLPLVVICILL